MKLPSEVILSVSLKPGAVFLYADDSFPDKKHFFVVLNKVIDENTTHLVLVCATSQIQKRQQFVQLRNLDSQTLVIAEPKDCTFLKVQTAFNCNTVYVRPIDYIKTKLDGDSVPTVQEVNLELLAKLQTGVLKSRMVDNKAKSLIR